MMKQLILRTLALLATSALLAASPAPAASPADDAKAIQGTWKPAGAELAGHRLSDRLTARITLTLSDGAYTVTVGDSTDKGTYKIDPSTHPRSITLTGTEGPHQGKTFAAIYELDGDILRICYDLTGQQAPKDFKTEPNTKLYLVTYMREKK
jgi:uncharacterized protein (TIGR03067 family)